MSYSLKNTLVQWAKDNEQRKADLQAALDAAVEKVLKGQGSQITNATTNSNSFTMQINMTNEAFASCLTSVLDHLNNGTTPTRRVVGGYRHE